MFDFIKKLTHQTPEEKFDQLRAKALKLEEAKNYQEAISTLKEALAIFPNNIQVMGEICVYLTELKRYKEIIDLSLKALRIAQERANKDNIGRFYGHIARSYKETKQFEKAIKYFKLAIANKPHYLNNHYELGICYSNLNLYDKSLETFKNIIFLDSDYSEKMDINHMIEMIYSEMANIYPERKNINNGFRLEKQGKTAEALNEFMEAYQKNNKSTIALYKISMLKSQNNEIKDAILFGLRTILAEKDTDKYENTFIFPTLFEELSKNYAKINDTRNSNKCKLLSEYYSTIYNGDKAKEDHKENSLVLASKYYKDAISIYGEDYEAYDKLIPIYIAYTLHSEALETLKNAFALAQKRKNNLKMAKYFHFAALCFWGEGNHEKAKEFHANAVKATTNLENKLNFNFDLALCYEYDKELPECLNQLQQCEKIIEAGAEDEIDIESNIIKIKALMDKNSDINKAKNFYQKGSTFLGQNNNKKAEECFKQSLELIPQDLKVINSLLLCFVNQKKTAEALNTAYEGYMVSKKDNDFRFFEKFICHLIFYYLTEEKNYNNALHYAIEAMKRDPTNHNYHYIIGACYINMGNFQTALEAFTNAYNLSHDPKYLQDIENCKNML